MGKGKGAPEEWVAVVKPGTVLYEMQGVPKAVAREAFRLASHKLPIGTRFLSRELADEGYRVERNRHRGDKAKK